MGSPGGRRHGRVNGAGAGRDPLVRRQRRGVGSGRQRHRRRPPGVRRGSHGRGALASRGFDRGPIRVLLAREAGNLLIYLLGGTCLAVGVHLGAAAAISLGVAPFLLGAALKLALATGLLPGAWQLAGRQVGA